MCDCLACGALEGEDHVYMCDMEICSKCRGQRISCGCVLDAEEIRFEKLSKLLIRNGFTQSFVRTWIKEKDRKEKEYILNKMSKVVKDNDLSECCIRLWLKENGSGFFD